MFSYIKSVLGYNTCDIYFCHCNVPYVNTSDISKQHWALFFNWKDKNLVYELGKNQGLITPSCTEGEPTPIYTRVLLSSATQVDPDAVHEAAMNCSLNGQPYSAGWNNCQQWTEEIANKLEIPLQYDKISGVPAFIAHLLPVTSVNLKR
ncbi:unnamed protein product [Meganyctiphanes norvegica]|uniref:Uncharacterized protein n=1 Tax=Meganyctiphanes norvegica TaxID=48144 RepID=A0AAV2PNJ2_MEGNR